MAGSQLTQLKASLSSAGLNRKSSSKKDRKQFKKGGAREVDRAKTFAKLEDIRRSLNKFDETETKVKHDAGGRNLKGVTGRPSASKQAGLEQRRKTLLPEHQLRGHTGTFRDRRFGESDPSLSLEDRMLERYTRERQRGQGKKGMFNLEDEDDGLELFDEGTALGGLTHGGRSVTDLPGDDFEMQGLGEADEDESGHGGIQRRIVSRAHFGGFDGDEEDGEDLPERKKSKAEVMSEIIAKSKEHKHERQQQKELDADLRNELDEDLDVLRELLEGGTSDQPGPSHKVPRRLNAPTGEDADYDQFVRTLAFEARAKPKDRTKTEDEIAVEEAERLQKAEAKRLCRMRGEEVSDEEDGEEGGYRKRRKMDKRGEADDLGDDFVDDGDDLLGPGITREALENMKLPVEREEESKEESEEDDDDDDEDDAQDDEEDSGEDEDEDDEMSAMEDLDDDKAPDLVAVDEDRTDGELVMRKNEGKGKAQASSTKGIPFTFPCPASIEDLEDILEGLEDSALPIVIQRIRALHHPSLAQGNKEKLQDFLGVLLDYTLILAARPKSAFELISSITPHIVYLVKLNPINAAHHFISKITLMQKNLVRGLARGAAHPDAKTLPGCPELVLIRFIGGVWSTSDLSHPVVAPTVLLIGQYLAQSRIRSLSDLASGLFLCSIVAQYEALSVRLVPEALNFVASALLALLPRRRGLEAPRSYPNLAAPDITRLSLSSSSTATLRESVDLAAVLQAKVDDDEVKVSLVAVASRLIQSFSKMYSSNAAFIEVFSPLLRVLEGSRLSKHSQDVFALHSSTQSSLSRMLGFARDSRQPLAMQAHKPIPIASYAPRFEEDFAPGHHYDPDAERNSSAKIKAMYKKERKGAIRELRKDNKFLAGEKAREQAEKDKAYNTKMRKVEGEINLERAEEKQMQNEKAREKRRAGRK